MDNEQDFVDLASKARELGVSEATLKGKALSNAVDCYVYLRERVEGTQDEFLPAWSYAMYPDVRWRDLGTPYDSSGNYEHGTNALVGRRGRVRTPNPSYELTGWVRLSTEFLATVFTRREPVSLVGWQVAVDSRTDECTPVKVLGNTEFMGVDTGMVTTCQQVEVADVMFLSESIKKIETLDPRREKSLLRIIRALDVMNKLPERGAAGSILLQLEQLGFVGPDEDTVRKIVKEARSLKP